MTLGACPYSETRRPRLVTTNSLSIYTQFCRELDPNQQSKSQSPELLFNLQSLSHSVLHNQPPLGTLTSAESGIFLTEPEPDLPRVTMLA